MAHDYKDLFTSVCDAEGCLDANQEYYALDQITMLKDFGPLRKGEKYDSIWFDIVGAKCRVYKEESEKPIHEFGIGLVAL